MFDSLWKCKNSIFIKSKNTFVQLSFQHLSEKKRCQRRKMEPDSCHSPGLFSFRPFRPPHSRTLEIRTRICFWHRDLLLFGQGLRLLATGRLAWSSLTARFCLMRELARAAIFPPSHLWEGGIFRPSSPPFLLGLAFLLFFLLSSPPQKINN